MISSNNCNFLINFETDNYFHSFHYPVYFEMAVKRRPTPNTEISYRDKRNFLPELFIENSCAALEAASETPCTCEGREGVVRDCLDCYAIFYNSIFSEEYSTMCPLKKRKVKPGLKVDWISPEMKTVRKRRRLFEVRWRRTKLNKREVSTLEPGTM